MKTTPLRNILYLLDVERYSISSDICKSLINEQVQKGLWKLEEDILREVAASQGKHGADQRDWMSSATALAARDVIRQCLAEGR